MNRTGNTKLLVASVASPMSQNTRDTSVFCKYSHRDCTQNCLEGYDYCIRHILEDKTAPYRQCAYITKAGRKCPSAAPKLEKKEGFCAFHTKKALLARQRLSRKRRLKETPDSMLEDLVVTTSAMEANHSSEPRRGKVHNDSIASRALDYASSSDSEAEPPLVEHAWRDSGDSDAESIDSDQEDVLKYAGVYTTEEVAQILRDKLIRLQALYIDQFKRLKHILFTKKRKYLVAQKKEKELFGSIKRYKDDPQQREKYKKLCAMKRYHKKFGLDALMQHKSTQRRLKVTEGMSHKIPTPVQCSFVDEGLRCAQTVVPLSKYCQKHILHDQNQVLYRPCPFADSQCGRPVPSLLGTPFCSLHQSLPQSSTTMNVAQEEVKLEKEEECVEAVIGGMGDDRFDRKPVMLGIDVKPERQRTTSSSSSDHYGGRHRSRPVEEMTTTMGIKLERQDPEERDDDVVGFHPKSFGTMGVVIKEEDVDDEDDDDAHGLR